MMSGTTTLMLGVSGWLFSLTATEKSLRLSSMFLSDRGANSPRDWHARASLDVGELVGRHGG